MAQQERKGRVIRINRAPVLTMWAAVVAERLGHPWDEALTIGRVVAGLAAYRKGVSLGIYEERPEDARARLREKALAGETREISLFGFRVLEVKTEAGWRAVDVDGDIIDPRAVERYLRRKFGDAYEEALAAMRALAAAYSPEELAQRGWRLYMMFRPQVPEGIEGWGRPGELDIGKIWEMARQAQQARDAESDS